MRSVSSVVIVAALAACTADGRITEPAPEPLLDANPIALQDGDNPNPILFPKMSYPYGVSIATWADREAQWIYGQPVENNPLIDQTGADCHRGQEGPVWFLPRIAGPRVHSGTRTCTIPPNKAILLEIGAYVNPYPCPDPDFEPAPGQTLYEFLIAGAKAFMDGVTHLEVSLDGQAIQDPMTYRYASEDIFTLTGDPSFSQLDPCVTGTPQPSISDGFFMMFKPLSPGQHTIRVYGTDIRGADKTYVYHLTVL